MKILTQRPTHISAVATVLLTTKTFTVKYYNRRDIKKYKNKNINNNTSNGMTHIKRDSECNGKEQEEEKKGEKKKKE